jgi:hypothetical protein
MSCCGQKRSALTATVVTARDDRGRMPASRSADPAPAHGPLRTALPAAAMRAYAARNAARRAR